MLVWILAACGTGDTGKGSSQVTAACQQYLDCAQAVIDAYGDSAGVTMDDVNAAYGEGGTCWSDPELSDQCDQACTDAVTSFATAFADIPACGGHITAAADWSGSGVSITVSTHSAGWNLGMVETGASSKGWAGEDCLDSVPSGYPQVDDYGVQVCHTLGSTGGTVYSVTDLSQVGDDTTLFTSGSNVTYALFETDDTTACYAWGDDPSYYSGAGCSAL